MVSNEKEQINVNEVNYTAINVKRELANCDSIEASSLPANDVPFKSGDKMTDHKGEEFTLA